MPNLKQEKELVAISKLKRRERIAALEDYCGFIVAKSVGATMFGTGALEFIAPEIIPITLSLPLAIAGAGFAILAGKQAASRLVDAIAVFLKS